MGTPKQPSLAPAHALGVRKSDPGIRSLGNDAGGRRRRPAGRRQGWDLAWEGPPGPCLAPGLLGSIRHQQEQAANSSHHGGTGAMEIRSRHSSYTAGNEEDDGMEEELSPFRGRSRSAPPNLWAAQRYGRELRRMSDEFEGSFKVKLTPFRCVQ
uniref:Bcl2-associated agonist of cell death n=1 Tax=Cricetulus griseus TaxID=10029 RepID=A0A8C2M216_CRIGR